MLFVIKEWGYNTTAKVAEFFQGENGPEYTPQQIQYYLNKFKLSFKYPFAFADDLAEYEKWGDEKVVSGEWIGDETPIEVAIETMHARQEFLDKTLNNDKLKGYVNDAYVIKQRQDGNSWITEEHLDEAARYIRTNPGAIKTLGDWRSYLKPSKFA